VERANYGVDKLNNRLRTMMNAPISLQIVMLLPERFVMSPMNHTPRKARDMPSALPVL
jgi:hypothetical protein